MNSDQSMAEMAAIASYVVPSSLGRKPRRPSRVFMRHRDDNKGSGRSYWSSGALLLAVRPEMDGRWCAMIYAVTGRGFVPVARSFCRSKTRAVRGGLDMLRRARKPRWRDASPFSTGEVSAVLAMAYVGGAWARQP